MKVQQAAVTKVKMNGKHWEIGVLQKFWKGFAMSADLEASQKTVNICSVIVADSVWIKHADLHKKYLDLGAEVLFELSIRDGNSISRHGDGLFDFNSFLLLLPLLFIV